MQRREAVRLLGAALAIPFIPRNADAALALGKSVHERLAGDVPFRTFGRDQQALVTTMAEIIIPETDTPGATRVKVPQFIDLMLTEWATEDERTEFLAGLSEIDARAAALGARQQGQPGAPAARFVELPADRRLELVAELDEIRNDASGAGLAFGRLKSLTVYGYCTSKAVEESLLKEPMFYDGYHGDVPFTPAS